mgnify:CR=1 FL=1
MVGARWWAMVYDVVHDVVQDDGAFREELLHVSLKTTTRALVFAQRLGKGKNWSGRGSSLMGELAHLLGKYPDGKIASY